MLQLENVMIFDGGFGSEIEKRNLDTNLCTCPKTESEARQLAIKNDEPQKKVKKDIIKNIHTKFFICSAIQRFARG